VTLIDAICRLAATSPVAALLMSVVLLLALLGIVRAIRISLEACEW
jgi:hypothetical protein